MKIAAKIVTIALLALFFVAAPAMVYASEVETETVVEVIPEETEVETSTASVDAEAFEEIKNILAYLLFIMAAILGSLIALGFWIVWRT